MDESLKAKRFLPLIDLSSKSLSVDAIRYSNTHVKNVQYLCEMGQPTYNPILGPHYKTAPNHQKHRHWCRINENHSCNCKLFNPHSPNRTLIRIDCTETALPRAIEMATIAKENGAFPLKDSIVECFKAQQNMDPKERNFALVYPILNTVWNHQVGQDTLVTIGFDSPQAYAKWKILEEEQTRIHYKRISPKQFNGNASKNEQDVEAASSIDNEVQTNATVHFQNDNAEDLKEDESHPKEDESHPKGHSRRRYSQIKLSIDASKLEKPTNFKFGIETINHKEQKQYVPKMPILKGKPGLKAEKSMNGKKYPGGRPIYPSQNQFKNVRKEIDTRKMSTFTEGFVYESDESLPDYEATEEGSQPEDEEIEPATIY